MNSFYSYLQGGRVAALALLMAAAAPAARAQAPAWQSVVGAVPGATFRAEVNATTTDAAGNVYVVGDFGGTIQLGGTTLTSAGGDNTFVAKWSPVSRSFVWALRLGGTGDDYGQAIAVSGANVYVGGFFRSPSLTVGGATVFNTSTPGSNSADGFVVKIIDAGSSASFGWAQRLGGAASEGIDGLVAVGSSVYVAGSFSSASADLGGTFVTSAGSSDALVAKLTDTGAANTVAWVQRAGGPGYDEAEAIAVVGSNVYLTGGFEQSASFGSTVLVNSTGGQGQPEAFVAKLTDAGTSAGFTWAVRGGGASSTYVRGLAASGSNVYVVGDFSGPTATFGSAVLTNAGGTARGNDAFVAKLADAGASGAFVWAQAAGGTDYDEANAVAVRGGSVYVAGHFASTTAAFGSTTLANQTAGTGKYDVFVARLRDAGPTGAFIWAQPGGSADDDYARAVALGGTTVYVAGSTRTPATFGSQVLSAPALTNAEPVAFMASLSDATGLPTASAATLPAIGLFPNPAHGRATVQLPAGTGPATLTVLDALGRSLRTQTVTSAKAELDLTDLTAGFYAVRVQAGGSAVTRWLVVE